MAKNHSQVAINNRANQLNPTHEAYWSSRGQAMPISGLSHLDNHANQMNPNNSQYPKFKNIDHNNNSLLDQSLDFSITIHVDEDETINECESLQEKIERILGRPIS